MSKYTIYCDGLCEPNPGVAVWAFIVFDERGIEWHRASGLVQGTTNNEAEYQAVIEALVWCHELADEFLILTDSQLVVNQINGTWQVKAENLKSWYDNAKDLIEPDANLTIAWVKGTENKADELTRTQYEIETGYYPMPRQKGDRYSKLITRNGTKLTNTVNYEKIAF